MTKVTYLGESKAVEFDGVGFEPGKAMDYDGPRLRKLRGNRFFEVTEAKQKAPAKAPAKQKAPANANAD